jgi:hypothetical protein
MKIVYYALCATPAACLVALWATPKNFSAGGPLIRIQLGLLFATMFLSPAFTLLGVTGVVAAKVHKESLLWPFVATFLAALPGLYLLWQKLSATA